MKYSESFEFVRNRAKFLKMQYFHDTKETVEHYFLAILFFATIDATKQPIYSVERGVAARLLEQRCKETAENMKNLLKKECQTSKEKLIPVEAYVKRAEEKAKNAMAQEVQVEHLFSAIMEKPTPIIGEYIKGYEKKDPKNGIQMLMEAERKLVEAERQKESKGLIGLAQKIESMASFISKDLKGQDHAVKAVADGYFNAEMLARPDSERKRPRATYLFAGPPGVGKTFMAEKMAEYLKLPHLCIDMSTCSDHQMGPMVFIGEQPSFSKAQSGEVTSFVKENPKCVLIFDEMEKAHKNVLHLFYQILDRGVLKDLKMNENISFQDAIIIMTTNVGHNLYEGKEEENISLLPKKMILNAIKNDINPQTKEAFFPEALVSRMGRGTVLAFDHLKSHNLQEIVQAELNRKGELFQKQYGMEVTFDEKIASLLMYQEGGMADARTLTGQAENFFKTQILRCLELFELEKIEQLTEKFDKLHFKVEDWECLEALDPVFKKAKTPEIVLYGNDALGSELRTMLPEFQFYTTNDETEAFDIFFKKDIEVIFIDPIEENVVNEQLLGDTFYAFDKINLEAKVFQKTWHFVEKVTEKYPGIPVYLLDRGILTFDEQTEFKLIQKNIRDVINIKGEHTTTYRTQISKCVEHSQLQQIALFLQSKHKMVRYEIAPYWHQETKEMDIRCRNYSLGDLIAVEDKEFLVSDAERPDIKFADVIGASAAKEELKFFIEYLKNPKQFIARGLKPPKGLLFYGPPGTGKTMLAKAMAGETDITFITETASNFVNSLVGSGPETIRTMFERARRYAPSILFIDEIDAIGRTRTGSSNTHNEEVTLNTLLTEMDGFKVDLKRPVFIIAATNFKVEEGVSGMGYIDPALIRRFDRKILIDLPNRTERLQLLTMLCRKVPDCQVSSKLLENIAVRSIGLSNANLSNVVSQAVRMAERKNSLLIDEIFEEAFETAVYGERKNWGHKTLERVAWHEAGHAYMYWKHGNTPSYLTIVARGNHGGYMKHDDAEAEAPLKTREELLENIRVSLAGRGSEIMRYGKEQGVSTGISGDLKQATKIAKQLICNYGMDEEFGMIYIDSEYIKQSDMAMLVHQKAAEILNEQMKKTLKELEEGRNKIELLVKELLDKNSMTGEEIDKVLGQEK